MPDRFSKAKLVALGAVLLLLIGVSTWIWWRQEEPVPAAPLEETPTAIIQETIGQSVEGRAIEAYTYGDGANHVLFVGGIHGGYEWNSILLAYDMMDAFTEDPSMIPKNVRVTVIPNLNPDGLYAVIPKEGRITWDDVAGADGSGIGRMNANGVDLNRNFDCKWQPTSSWRGSEVSAGTAPFSEPEARALRDFVRRISPEAVVFWHSQANAVYASECEAGILPETLELMNLYATTAGYQAVDTFDAYPVTGDAEGWLASIGIPAITVELSTHETTDWQKNLAAVSALLNELAAAN